MTLAIFNLQKTGFSNEITDVEPFCRCGHCKRLKPEFQKAASILKANDPPVTLAQVDCTDAGKDTCGRFEVSGYPTVKIFRNGELSSDYNGPRETGGIGKFWMNFQFQHFAKLRTKLIYEISALQLST